MERQAIVCFMPMAMLEKIIRSKRAETCETLFPNYLFIGSDLETIHITIINATRGVRQFVRFGSLPVLLFPSQSFKNCAPILSTT